MFLFSNSSSIKTKILISTLGLSLLTLISVGWLGYSTGKTTIGENQFRQLTSIREIRAKQIEKYFQNIENIKNALDLPRNVGTNQLLNVLGEYSFDNLIITKNISLINKYKKFLECKDKINDNNIFQ